MEGIFFRFEGLRSGTVIMGAGSVPMMGRSEAPMIPHDLREFILNAALVLLILIASTGILLLGRYLARLLSTQILTPLEEMRTAAAAIQRGDLEIQPQTHRVFVAGREVRLATREFELLLFLAQNPQIVFNKETLYDRVWSLDALGSTSTVAVHINRLREKIEPDPSNPRWIETVWGAGYRFNSNT